MLFTVFTQFYCEILILLLSFQSLDFCVCVWTCENILIELVQKYFRQIQGMDVKTC